jgi:hypothetical protein
VKNGASLTTAKLATIANTVTHGLNSSFILKFTSLLNATTCNNKATVRDQFSVLLLMFNVSADNVYYCANLFFYINVHFFVAYGVGDEMQQLNPDGAPSLLSDMINNALPPPMIKDVKNNELAVSTKRSSSFLLSYSSLSPFVAVLFKSITKW